MAHQHQENQTEAQRDIVLQSTVFAVERLQVTLRGGETAVRHIVRHPGAVCVLFDILDVDVPWCCVGDHRMKQ